MRYFRGASLALKVMGILALVFLLGSPLMLVIWIPFVLSSHTEASDTRLLYVAFLLMGMGQILGGLFLWLAPQFQRGAHAVQPKTGNNPAMIPALQLLTGLFTGGLGLALIALPESVIDRYVTVLPFLPVAFVIALGAIVIGTTLRSLNAEERHDPPHE
jgi:hypothetical protein